LLSGARLSGDQISIKCLNLPVGETKLQMYSARANIELLVGVESEVAVFVYRFQSEIHAGSSQVLSFLKASPGLFRGF